MVSVAVDRIVLYVFLHPRNKKRFSLAINKLNYGFLEEAVRNDIFCSRFINGL